ncbi:unnamed protein product [Hydatigera taeniaeformis]|uniref:Uncharacterized protein n=1 Tax=Hydatigena taeniaeformis TaxID=6205 RepID=A0A0R3X307_HYDTA|nr:unnamed protein product [Hydatigera taeniaeformis]
MPGCLDITANEAPEARRQAFKLLFLIAFVSAVFARHPGHHWRHGDEDDDDYYGRRHGYSHHREHDHDDDDEDDDDERDEDDSDDREKNRTQLITASGGGHSRRVMWSGSSSYPGYKRYHRRPLYRPAVPPRTYLSRRGLITPSPPVRPVALHNKERAKDLRYRQGLQELRDLIRNSVFVRLAIESVAIVLNRLHSTLHRHRFNHVLGVVKAPHRDGLAAVEKKSAARRSVIWSGANSYPGFRDSRRRRHERVHRQDLSEAYAKYTAQSAKKPKEPIRVKLYNKERANDQRYREGLQELASLM